MPPQDLEETVDTLPSQRRPRVARDRRRALVVIVITIATLAAIAVVAARIV